VPVSREALVLEVGSGGNPYPRANVLLDAYEETRERHWDPLVSDRPTVLAFGEQLPFRDQAFDFVIAAHVLEHSAHPERFLRELQRVARAGYIETPDAFMERINPYRDHRLEVTVREGRLIIRKKPKWVVDQDVVELYEHRAKPQIAGSLIPSVPEAFHVRHFWQGQIAFEVLNPEVDATWPGGDSTPSIPAETGRAVLRRHLLRWLRSAYSQSTRNRQLDILPLLRCPQCLDGPVVRADSGAVCTNCRATYASRNGVWLMATSVSTSNA
jgi:SAM-dependent methyltransferase